MDDAHSTENELQLSVNGQLQRPSGLPATTTLLNYLREQLGLKGTKEGCAEGDCGACSVLLVDRDGDGQPRCRAINSCIRLLPTLDGKAVLTVEALASSTGLHPVQQAMVDHHASQCGFCTPGFVMALYALYQAHAAGPRPSRAQVIDALSGNLCRCTGYRPIIDAALAMHDYPAPDTEARALALSTLSAPSRERPLQLPGFRAPRSEDEFAACLLEAPQSLILAGGTDIGLWVTKQLRRLPPLLYLGEASDLGRVEERDGSLCIGAAVSLTDAWAALTTRLPAVAELASRFASPPVRNSGTLVGNLANGSPIGDSAPLLLALGAKLRLRRGDEQRSVALEAFYLGYQQKNLAPGEFIAEVCVPLPPPGTQLAAYKLSKRIDQDISAVCLGICMQLDGDRVADIRIGVGGMAATCRRALAAEHALRGERWCSERIDAAIAELSAEFRPLSDLRASADYRLRGAGALLRRFFLAHPLHGAPPLLRLHELEPLSVATVEPGA